MCVGAGSVMQYAWLCESFRAENPGPKVARSRTEAAGYDQIAPPYTRVCTEIRDEKLPGHLVGPGRKGRRGFPTFTLCSRY